MPDQDEALRKMRVALKTVRDPRVLEAETDKALVEVADLAEELDEHLTLGGVWPREWVGEQIQLPGDWIRPGGLMTEVHWCHVCKVSGRQVQVGRRAAGLKVEMLWLHVQCGSTRWTS